MQSNGSYKSLDEIVLELITDHYNVSNIEKAKYIMSKYDIENHWEYLAIDNVKDYVYDIKLILK